MTAFGVFGKFFQRLIRNHLYRVERKSKLVFIIVAFEIFSSVNQKFCNGRLNETKTNERKTQMGEFVSKMSELAPSPASKRQVFQSQPIVFGFLVAKRPLARVNLGNL